MFKRVLIANRGEIAVRVAATLREMDISPCTVFAEADRGAPHVRAADAAVAIGPSPARESYLVIDKIIAAAKTLGAEAIHPGYGFLSENAAFAAACEKAGLVFIGPPSKAIAAMGSKTGARQLMTAAGVPVVPGTLAPLDGSDEEVAAKAKEIGYPLMLKAVSGGGGKGMRLVRSSDELAAALRGARSEAKSAFGDDRVYWEKAIEKPRHVEIQIFCDSHGNGVYLGERDCSVQRRHQKIIEESPSTAVGPTLRAAMGEVAVKGALAVGYRGAGTMEFLLDKDGKFYFLEMNTRLQVEHAVTEAVFGVDLVREQLRVASGEKLSFRQDQLVARGHAIEARVYAEDPSQNFMPAPGTIRSLTFPHAPFVRVDSGVVQGYTVPLFYDPMIAKITAWAETRPLAIARLRQALRSTVVLGIKTNLAFLDTILAHPAFVAGDVHTGFIAEHLTTTATTAIEEKRLRAMTLGAVLQQLERAPTSAAAATTTDSLWLKSGRLAGLTRDLLK